MAMNAHDYIAALVEKAQAAQAVAENFTQEDIELLTGAVAYGLTKPELAEKFANMLVDEGHMGNVQEDRKAHV